MRLFWLIYLPLILAGTDFMWFLLKGERLRIKYFSVVLGIASLGLAIWFLMIDYTSPNDCCGGSAFLSPAHRLTMYTLIGLCSAAFFFTEFKHKIAPPVIEVLTNCLLL